MKTVKLKGNKMDKLLKDVESQLNLIYKMTQDDDEFDKDDFMLRSLIALSALREYKEKYNETEESGG